MQVTGLPDGLSALLSGNEIDISGTPTQFGVFPIGVTLNDSSGTPLSKTYSLSVLPELNAKIINWLPTVLHSRVGGGECTHLIAEALRICGGAFVDPAQLNGKEKDPFNNPNYNWGTLIATLQYNGNNLVSTPGSLSKVLPGDIVQYVTGTTRHMAIVAEVGPTGMPAKLFEQQVDDDRRVFLMPCDLTRYNGGDMIRILRPVPRPAQPPHGYLEFSVVNNSSQQLKLRVQTSDGQAKADMDLDAANTKNSYKVGVVPAQPGNFTWVLQAISSDGKTVLSIPITISNETGYEIFDNGNGLAIRSLP